MTAYTDSNVTLHTRRSMTLTLTDSAGTPNTFQIRAASVTIQHGGYEIVRARDESGDFLGAPRRGPQSGPSTIQITGKLFGAGGSTASLHLPDVLTESGTIMASLTDTQSAYEGFVWASMKLYVPDAGTLKGATYSLANVIVQPGSVSITSTDEGFDVQATFESPAAKVTITENA